MGHQTARRDVADQAELAALRAAQRAHSQDRKMPRVPPAFRRLGRLLRKGECRLLVAVVRQHYILREWNAETTSASTFTKTLAIQGLKKLLPAPDENYGLPWT